MAHGFDTARCDLRRARELAVRFADERKYFVSEASVYRLLKAHDLITSPAYVVIKAADEFKDKTTAINQLWQTDFTYLKITGCGSRPRKISRRRSALSGPVQIRAARKRHMSLAAIPSKRRAPSATQFNIARTPERPPPICTKGQCP